MSNIAVGLQRFIDYWDAISMNIWIIDHYSVPIKYYPLARQRNFAKYLIKKGHSVTIFAASSVHNSYVNLIEDNADYREYFDDEIKYVLVKCHSYQKNGLKRIFNMFEFAYKLKRVCDGYSKPDIVIATSMTQLACAQGIRLARKYGCKVIAQITDLWPETIVSYGVASRNNPIVVMLRFLEKWTYKNADKIIFSMEGAYDYIKEQGWDMDIPRGKVYFINNGVDKSDFTYNANEYVLDDEDLKDDSYFKVIYTGSIRKVNNLDKILDVAKNIQKKYIKFIIFGDGDERSRLEKRLIEENIKNVIFKGKVDKKFIPYIVQCADLNYAHNDQSSIFRYGISFNKIFDYFAAGKPIISDFYANYNPIAMEKAGINVQSGDPIKIAYAIEELSQLSDDDYKAYCSNAKAASEKYDFKRLTDYLEEIICDLVNK